MVGRERVVNQNDQTVFRPTSQVESRSNKVGRNYRIIPSGFVPGFRDDDNEYDYG